MPELKLRVCITAFIFLSYLSFSQQNTEYKNAISNDSLINEIDEYAQKIDSMNFIIKDIIITGNKITKEEIILREMSLKKGSIFSVKKYTDDYLNIYNLGLFLRVDILPIPVSVNEMILNIDVLERWFILPLPMGGIEDNEWKKLWAGLNIRWDNFRGMNESINFGFRVFYNPGINFKYTIPWIGEKLRLFSSIGGAWKRTRNKSLNAVGKQSGENTLTYEDDNYDNIHYKAEFKIGKYLTKNLSVFTEYKYNHLRVTSYKPGRTLSPSGTDKYLTLGLGLSYDTRDIYEYATKGIYSRAGYERFGFISKEINFGRWTFENQSFLPIYLTKNYYLTVAAKIYHSQAFGAVIPYYSKEYLGYSDDYIRGWKSIAFEGDNILTFYNEIRIPILKPRYVKAKDIAVVKEIPIVKNLDLRHGLYFTLIYDIGTIWYKGQNLFNKKFLSGTGIGLNFIAPFGYVLRAEWCFRLTKPIVGQISFGLSAKF